MAPRAAEPVFTPAASPSLSEEARCVYSPSSRKRTGRAPCLARSQTCLCSSSSEGTAEFPEAASARPSCARTSVSKTSGNSSIQARPNSTCRAGASPANLSKSWSTSGRPSWRSKGTWALWIAARTHSAELASWPAHRLPTRAPLGPTAPPGALAPAAAAARRRLASTGAGISRSAPGQRPTSWPLSSHCSASEDQRAQQRPSRRGRPPSERRTREAHAS
mmetsp:Transcript_40876/g.108038  ORF Transcript_40876/g.108038 Transcript_40876/m.108038 type:complete len:220 (-) Transcript_40876:273-932(-)